MDTPDADPVADPDADPDAELAEEDPELLPPAGRPETFTLVQAAPELVFALT